MTGSRFPVPRVRSGPGSDDLEAIDPYGLDEQGRGSVSSALREFVPQSLAHRGLTVSVLTDRSAYDVGDTVTITIEASNRLPLPITVVTDGPRIWGWAVDGQLEASDESRYSSDRPNTLAFRALESKTFQETWDGRFKRTGSPTRWIEARPGEYEISGFVATGSEAHRDRTMVVLR